MKKLTPLIFILSLVLFQSTNFAQLTSWGMGSEFIGLEPSGERLKGTVPLTVYASVYRNINENFDFIFRPGIMLSTFAPQIDFLIKYSLKNGNYFIAGAKAHMAVNYNAENPPTLTEDFAYAIGVGIMLTPKLAITFTHYGSSFAWMGLDYRFGNIISEEE